MDVLTWLRGIGLERYGQAFAEHDIDPGLLPRLTARDLEEIGVGSVGHRRRMLDAIAELGHPAPRAPPTPRSEAERRRLTVMFVDLVGSTFLSRQLDPEQLRDVMHAYQNAVAGEIARFDGHLAKFMGDGVLAYFGWPRAHEDEAERAVRAGLAITDAVRRLVLPSAEHLAARVGIATGPVVVGELIGEGAAQEQAVVGETPNLAARLQGVAAPGEVVVAAATRRLLGGTFDLIELGAQTLRGFEGPVAAWRVGGAALVEGRFEAHRGPSPAPMVGRERELALLLERWAMAKSGAGQTVLIVGEAGIGKSRVARAVLDAVTGEPHARLRLQCSPQHTESALWPATEELALAAVLDAASSMDARMDALERLLSGAADDADASAPVIEGILDPGAGQRDGASMLPPEARRERTLQALTSRLLALASGRPLLVLVEDAQWIDPTTLELLSRLTAAIVTAPVLLVVTTRPERQSLLRRDSHVTRLDLGRLSRAEMADMVARLVEVEAPPEPLLRTVAARTDGVPLFVEELVKALIDEGLPADGGLPDMAVPASLHDMLMARLDRLPEAKEVAQIAACIGREFEEALLEKVAAMPAAALRTALDRLCQAEIVLPRDAAPEPSYTFKHALLCDAAYESLLRSRRRALHERVVGALENVTSGGQRAPERIARHAAAAELWAKALHHWSAAGKAAMDRAAYAEAIGLLRKALDAGTRLGRGPEVEIEMIDLRRTLSWAAGTIGDVPTMMASLRDAEASAARLSLGRLKCELRTQRAHFESLFGGSVLNAIRHGRDALRMAEASRNRELVASARFVLGEAHWLTGEYRAAIGELGLDAPDYLRGLGTSSVVSGGTLAIAGLAVLGGCHGLLGELDQALRHGDAALAIAQETGRPFDAVVAGYHLARTHLANGHPDSALPLIERNVDLGRRYGLLTLLPWSLSLHGHAQTLLGRPREGLSALDEALQGCAAVRLQYARVCTLLYRAEACRAANADDPAAVAGEALAQAQACHYRALEVGAHRLLAEIALARNEPETAAAQLGPALEIAQKLGLSLDLEALRRLSAQPSSRA